MPTPATTNKQERDYLKEAICRTSGEGIATNDIAREGYAKENTANNEGIVLNDVASSANNWLDISHEVVRGRNRGSEYLPFEWDVMNLERDPKDPQHLSAPRYLESDVVSLDQDLLPSEEPPTLLMEATPTYEDLEDLQHHSSLPEVRLSTIGEPQMRWREGDMATIYAHLQASESIFFSKLLTHKHLALRRRQQLYLPVLFINQHRDKLEEWIVLRTRSSNRTWRVLICFFKKPRG